MPVRVSPLSACSAVFNSPPCSVPGLPDRLHPAPRLHDRPGRPHLHRRRHRDDARLGDQPVDHGALPAAHREVEGLPATRAASLWRDDRQPPPRRRHLLARLDGRVRERALVRARHQHDHHRHVYQLDLHVVLGAFFVVILWGCCADGRSRAISSTHT